MTNTGFYKNQEEIYSRQIIYKIINSRVINYPYPHAETRDLLPDELLTLIDKNFPSKNEFISLTSKNIDMQRRLHLGMAKDKIVKNNNEHPYDFRYQIYLTEKNHISRIKGSKLTFWKFFTKILTSESVIRSLLKLYDKNLRIRFAKNLKDMLFYPDIMLIHDKANYALGPHTDISQKVITILIYLSSEEKNTNLYGTSIYIPKKNNFICDGKRHHKHKDFYKIYTSSFKKNNSFSFFRTNNSFHGVETVQEQPIERKLIQYSIMVNGS